MPSGYNEIPGLYSETPRPLPGFRRTLRTYRWGIGATACILLIILVVFVSVFNGTSSGNSATERNEELASGPPENQTIQTLLSLPWPRRDEEWYKNRWSESRMRRPFDASSNNSYTEPYTTNESSRVKRQADDNILSYEGHFQDGGSEEFRNSEFRNFDDCVISKHAKAMELDSYDGSTYPRKDTFNWNREASCLPKMSALKIWEVLSRTSKIEKDKSILENELFTRNIFLKKGMPAFYHQKAFRKTSPIVHKMSRQGFRMDSASVEVKKMLKLSKEESTFDSRWLGDLNQSPYCDNEKQTIKCSKWDIYRGADGTCNNLAHPYWGSAFTSFRRAMPPDYADGIALPRKTKRGDDLPNARLVSMKVHTWRNVDSQSYTYLAMAWGQFIDHDITATAQAKGKNGTGLSCCHEEVKENKSLSHPECFEIYIPEEDEFFRSRNKTCMEFSRSASAPRCTFGPRKQLNQNTHFLDGSVIYGSLDEDMNNLRTHKEGLMKMQTTVDGRQLLHPSLNPDDSCNTEQQTYWQQYCFVSGDSRVNEHILLTILHTVWTQQHNFIALKLKDINPQWDDEKLFQETRKIIIAQMQHITYHEFVPIILGPYLSSGLKLNPEFFGNYWKGYDPKVHPGIANGFAGGAFRFGHSMIQGLLQSIDASGVSVKFEQLRKYFFNPFSLYDPTTIPDMVRGEVSQHSAAVDVYFTEQVTKRLFQTHKTDYGLDLVAINIQRGRDHGLPSYTRWRMMCGLPHVKHFGDLKDQMDIEALRAIEQVYRDVDDIDLYTGGLAELPVMDGMVGSTFACIIADQFLRLKIGDRFWYENGNAPSSFTKEQLSELHKTTLAGILCDNVDGLGSIQRWALRTFSTDNPRLPCPSSAIPRMSLDPWEEGKI